MSPITRTSDLLRGILTNNPDTKVFTIETIMRSIGEDQFDANLIFISLPTLAPLPGSPGLKEVSAAVVAGQMAVGRPQLSLPRSLLDKEVPRRVLAVALHAALPVIEAAEKFARPRFKWMSHPWSRRVLGAFLFVLAATVAFPLIGFDPLQSLATFSISLGLAEGDGAAILLGVAIGTLSLALIVASNLSFRAIRSKAADCLRRVARKLGCSALARFCERHGLHRLARILSFDWTEMLLVWDPERPRAPRTPAPGRRSRRTHGTPHGTSRAIAGAQTHHTRNTELVAA